MAAAAGGASAGVAASGGADCDHWYGLAGTHGWLFAYCRCWWCDLQWRAGWRWRYPSVGSVIAAYQEAHPDEPRAC